ncbi:kelch repeat protein [Anaeramoeba flamelloides]|uniref:Kelch repeat protein n=1 Tax=Anaeramoeba flamelloides TaxID=1746091 RepID=A0ABQ8XLX6_9EUKA|nr:kelch repeat protein [Anaeramoeba flamelloides]
MDTNHNNLFEWKNYKLPNQPPGRASHQATRYKNRMIVVGGGREGSTFEDIHSLDLQTMEWTEITPSKGKFQGCCHTLLTYGDKLWVYGGIVEERRSILRDLQSFDLKTYQWEQVQTQGQNPSYLYHHTANVWDHNMIIYGGRSSQWFNLGVYYFDFKTSKWRITIGNSQKKIPTPRYLHSSVVYDNKLWVFGGLSIDDKELNDLNYFDLVEETWNLVKPQNEGPSPRRSHRAILTSKNTMMLFGGFGNDLWFNDLWEFDFKTLIWRKHEYYNEENSKDIPTNRRVVSLIEDPENDKIIIFAGYLQEEDYTDQLYIFNLSNQIVRDFHIFLNKQVLCDLKVKTNEKGKTYGVHKCILDVRLGENGEVDKFLKQAKEEDPETVWSKIEEIYCGKSTKFTLSKNTFPKKLEKRIEIDFQKLYANKKNTDFQIIIENDGEKFNKKKLKNPKKQIINAHQAILAARSNLYYSFLNFMGKGLNSVTETSGLNLESLNIILYFIYTDNIDVKTISEPILEKLSNSWMFYQLSNDRLNLLLEQIYNEKKK